MILSLARLNRALLFTAAGLGLALMAGAASAQDSEGIVVYNAQHEALTQAWANGFTKETGIKVTIRNGSDMQFANQIVEEGPASPADVFLTENSPGMALVDAAGLFAPVNADTLAQVPDTFKASDGHWIGVAARSTVFVYDKTKLKESDLPKSLLDLADPAWKGRWGAAPAGADFQAIVSALLELKGEDVTKSWLKALKENANAYKNNNVTLKAVNSGEIEGGIIYHYYWFGDQAKTGENSNNTALHYFKNQDPGAFVSLSGGGILASSQHQKEAQAFLKWITGKGGQEILRDGDSYEYAVGNGVQSNPKLVPLPDLQAPRIEPSKLNSKEVTDLMTDAGLI
ncbi:iron ABC transporter substrate-binding protein [Neorhizobium sp. P12A]|uniref:iron ABC transporter substrate-binding protein n=1 Tax=Neorhizobium sp. P12A TaxID=2268027 RepID=UPI0011EEA1AA|nr:iron ABC transporter substrate-binding protein [Neorhizobium sp. P12A]KAA0699086.1 iron ABC transporter substrate-binding protein [Neorhizobium sp. P12A]